MGETVKRCRLNICGYGSMFCDDVYDSGYDEYDKDFEEHHNEDECVEIVQERPVGGEVWLADKADGTGEDETDTGGYI